MEPGEHECLGVANDLTHHGKGLDGVLTDGGPTSPFDPERGKGSYHSRADENVSG
jgi:hypothetical protein